jgi:CRP/FNR family transcriptional regulator, cyclic AMP receptor protein
MVASHGWLAACPADFRDWMIANLSWQRFSAGSGITYGGDDEGGLYCVGDGQIAFVASIGSADAGTGHNGLPGTWWGHAPLLGGPRVGSVVASIDTQCGMVRQSTLRARLAAHPSEWEAISRGIADLFLLSAGAHADLLIADSQRRVAATLLRMGGWRHRCYRLSPPATFVCSQDTLASATALTRNTVGKILRQLIAEGLIETGYGRVTIRDTKRLRTIANDD